MNFIPEAIAMETINIVVQLDMGATSTGNSVHECKV